VEACPTGAQEKLGVSTTVEELVRELCKDRAYFEKSGGGVTLSGGEPTLQPHFSFELVSQLKAAGLNVALDTCLLSNRQTLELLFPLVDIFLVDLKLIDPEQHPLWTGAPLEPILDSLNWLADELRRSSTAKTLWIRTPLIPAATFTQENISGISAYLTRLNDVVARWELCAFNNLCRDKYARLDMDWKFQETSLMTRAELDLANTWAHSGGFDPQRIFITGAARLEDI
jgi:pyruvate formate lyase activating enzyme